MAENSRWPCLKILKYTIWLIFSPSLSAKRHSSSTVQTNLCDKYATVIKSRFDSELIEGLGVEFITRASLNWVSQVAYDHVIALISAF